VIGVFGTNSAKNVFDNFCGAIIRYETFERGPSDPRASTAPRPSQVLRKRAVGEHSAGTKAGSCTLERMLLGPAAFGRLCWVSGMLRRKWARSSACRFPISPREGRDCRPFHFIRRFESGYSDKPAAPSLDPGAAWTMPKLLLRGCRDRHNVTEVCLEVA